MGKQSAPSRIVLPGEFWDCLDQCRDSNDDLGIAAKQPNRQEVVGEAFARLAAQGRYLDELIPDAVEVGTVLPTGSTHCEILEAEGYRVEYRNVQMKPLK